MKIGFLSVGFKGFLFLEQMLDHGQISFVSSYEDKHTLDTSYLDIQKLCRDNNIPFYDRKKPESLKLQDNTDLIFVVGWQFLFDGSDPRYIVMHDSLLPRLRGFCPVVTALIAGHVEIGCTAFQPTAQVDAGPVYGSESVLIKYPLKIKEAYKVLSQCYARLAMNLMTKKIENKLLSQPQDDSKATYSLWRDEQDYFIPWEWPAEKIQRFVDAVGWPFQGARTHYRDQLIIVDSVSVSSDMDIEERKPGKIWSLEDGSPHVICGQGIVKILSARDQHDHPIEFKELRHRLH